MWCSNDAPHYSCDVALMHHIIHVMQQWCTTLFMWCSIDAPHYSCDVACVWWPRWQAVPRCCPTARSLLSQSAGQANKERKLRRERRRPSLWQAALGKELAPSTVKGPAVKGVTGLAREGHVSNSCHAIETNGAQFTQRKLLVDIAPTRNSDWMYQNTGKSNWIY